MKLLGLDTIRQVFCKLQWTTYFGPVDLQQATRLLLIDQFQQMQQSLRINPRNLTQLDLLCKLEIAWNRNESSLSAIASPIRQSGQVNSDDTGKIIPFNWPIRD